MKTSSLLPSKSHANVADNPPSLDAYADITAYYNIAGPDYEAWSRHFNMHFGYCRHFGQIFSLERMLREMNDQVIATLQINPQTPSLVADLGCGAGTVARHLAKKFPKAVVKGITISDYQIKKGSALIEKDQLTERVELVIDNFEALHIADNTFTQAYAIESACHAHGDNKPFFISELARVLQPGAPFCIADGFLKHSGRRPRFFNYLYQKLLRYWALPSFAPIEDFTATLEKNGLTNITVREISWRIAPSVAYVPWTCIKFFATELWKHRSLRLKKERWHNVYGPLLGMILGLYRRHFGYYIITGKKATTVSTGPVL